MKRNVIFFVGLLSTLLMFSCNKQKMVGDDEILIENGRIRISSGCSSDAKPTFYNKTWRFNASDEVWINGVKELVYPYNRRQNAHIWTNLASDGIYKALYPASAFPATIANIDTPAVYIYPRVRVMRRTAADTVNPGSSIDHRVMPMTAYLENPVFDDHLYFHNTMALIGLKFLYGEGFGNAMMDYVQSEQLEFPLILIDSITVVARDGRTLWGNGYIDAPYSDTPQVVLPHVAGHQQVSYFGEFEELVINTSPTRDAVPNSYLPIIPCDGYFTINVYFHSNFEDIGMRRFCYSKESSYLITFPRSAILNTNILMDSQSDFTNYVTLVP